jgi:hypothetical protein
MPNKRNKTYYRNRLQIEHPSEFTEVQAGRKEFWAAVYDTGLKSRPKPLNGLKNAWKRASKKDQDDFLDWLNAEYGIRVGHIARSSTGSTASTAKTSSTIWLVDVTGTLTKEAVDAISSVMKTRNIKPGVLMREIGAKPLNASVASAMYGNSKIRDDKIKDGLKKWLKKHGHTFS